MCGGGWGDKKKPLPKDFKSLKALAEKGDTDAQFNLGVMYDKGDEVTQDSTEAVKWYLKAAEQGHVEAQNYLAKMYDKGQGVEKDNAKALEGIDETSM